MSGSTPAVSAGSSASMLSMQFVPARRTTALGENTVPCSASGLAKAASAVALDSSCILVNASLKIALANKTNISPVVVNAAVDTCTAKSQAIAQQSIDTSIDTCANNPQSLPRRIWKWFFG